MKLKRYEILLPLNYNDGTEIEKEKFDLTNEDLVIKFGAVTFDSIVASGHWLYKGVLYKDQLIRFRIDTEDSKEAREFFSDFKITLKQRFQQLDIWITAHNIEVI
jgi:hypothetical protein